MERAALLQHRILFLAGEVTAESANRLVADLLLLDADDHQRSIDLYVNSPGGNVLDGMAVIDTMHCIQAPVSTVCVGQAASMGAWLVAAGERGKRFGTPNAEMMIHQIAWGMAGHTEDIRVRTEQMVRLQEKMVHLLAGWTGQSAERIRQDMNRDFFMTATAAREYGLIDEVLLPFSGAVPTESDEAAG